MNLLGTATQLPSLHADPFSKAKIESITTRMERPLFGDGGFKFKATISFKNGNTSGAQNFEAASYPALFAAMQAFIDSLI